MLLKAINVAEGNSFSFLLVFVAQRLMLLKAINVAEGNSFSFLLVGSVGNVSAVFVVAVSHGLGTNPAAVLLFRKRSPSTFWLGFAWWLAGLQVFRCTKVNVAEGN